MRSSFPQTQKELEIARDWNGGGRQSIHLALTRVKEDYESRPKAPDGSVLGTVAEAPTLKNNGHTKSSLMRLDPANLENSRALHEGGRVR
jgi:hypothetical protein